MSDIGGTTHGVERGNDPLSLSNVNLRFKLPGSLTYLGNATHEDDVRVEYRPVSRTLRILQYPLLDLHGSFIFLDIPVRFVTVEQGNDLSEKDRSEMKITVGCAIQPRTKIEKSDSTDDSVYQANLRAWCTMPFRSFPAKTVIEISCKYPEHDAAKLNELVRLIKGNSTTQTRSDKTSTEPMDEWRRAVDEHWKDKAEQTRYKPAAVLAAMRQPQHSDKFGARVNFNTKHTQLVSKTAAKSDPVLPGCKTTAHRDYVDLKTKTTYFSRKKEDDEYWSSDDDLEEPSVSNRSGHSGERRPLERGGALFRPVDPDEWRKYMPRGIKSAKEMAKSPSSGETGVVNNKREG